MAEKPTGIVIHNFVLPDPRIRKKIIYHFSDVHLALSDDQSTPEEIKAAQNTSNAWLKGRKRFAESYGNIFSEDQNLPAQTHFDNLLLCAARDSDALVMCGDIFDYVSPANLRYFDKQLAEYPVPYMAVCGNHEADGEIPDDSRFAAVRQPVQLLELEDLIIVGINNARLEVSDAQNQYLLEALNSGKPAVIAMHVPVRTEENGDLLDKCGDYFKLNHRKATRSTLEFIDILKSNDDKILAVLAGHLHFDNNTSITPELMQYVSGQGIIGNINRYEIGI